MPDAAIIAVALAALALAAVPWVWVWRQRGPRRVRSTEGRIDGLLLMATLLLTLFAAVMSAVAIVRGVRERREFRHSRPAVVRIERCAIEQRRNGGRMAGRSWSLSCELAHEMDGTPMVDTVRAGFPSRSAGYVAWVSAHPPGMPFPLRRMTRPPYRLVGFEQVVPSTRTAGHAAGRALGFSLAALLALLVSRLLVRMRPR